MFTSAGSLTELNVYNTQTNQTFILPIPDGISFVSHKCEDLGTKYIVCLQAQQTKGILFDINKQTAAVTDFGLYSGPSQTVTYTSILGLYGYDSLLVVVGERNLLSVPVIAFDTYFVGTGMNLTLINSVKTRDSPRTIDCSVPGDSVYSMSPSRGYLLRHCKTIAN